MEADPWLLQTVLLPSAQRASSGRSGRGLPRRLWVTQDNSASLILYQAPLAKLPFGYPGCLGEGSGCSEPWQDLSRHCKAAVARKSSPRGRGGLAVLLLCYSTLASSLVPGKGSRVCGGIISSKASCDVSSEKVP